MHACVTAARSMAPSPHQVPRCICVFGSCEACPAFLGCALVVRLRTCVHAGASDEALRGDEPDAEQVGLCSCQSSAGGALRWVLLSQLRQASQASRRATMGAASWCRCLRLGSAADRAGLTANWDTMTPLPLYPCGCLVMSSSVRRCNPKFLLGCSWLFR